MGLTYDRIFAPIVNTVLESFTAPEQRTRARAIRQQMAECEINMLVTRDLSENTCANRLTANRYRGINVTRDAFKCGLLYGQTEEWNEGHIDTAKHPNTQPI